VTTALFRVVCVVGLLVGLVSPARADLIVADPNAFALGTNLSAVFPGLTLSRLTNQAGSTEFRPVATSVFASPTYHQPGTLSFGGPANDLDRYDACSTLGASINCAYNVLEVRFDTPTSFFQLDSIFFTDMPGIIVYDTSGNRLSGFTSVFTPRNTYDGAGTFTMSRGTADIGRVVFGGLFGATPATRVSYNVPEPMTLGLMGLGLVGAGVFTRRRRKSSR
jgi:hypothetical protein